MISKARIGEGRVARILEKSKSLAAKGDELAELIEAWDMAAYSITHSTTETKLDFKKTEDAAGRLRGMRADLFQLLNGLPDEHFDDQTQPDYDGSGSGDYGYDTDKDTVELVFDTSTGTFDDVALLVRNGAIDPALLQTSGDPNKAQLELGDEESQRGLGLYEKVSQPS